MPWIGSDTDRSLFPELFEVLKGINTGSRISGWPVLCASREFSRQSNASRAILPYGLFALLRENPRVRHE